MPVIDAPMNSSGKRLPGPPPPPKGAEKGLSQNTIFANVILEKVVKTEQKPEKCALSML